jgi:hypothetical protein
MPTTGYNNTRSTKAQDVAVYNTSENPVFKVKLRGLDNELEQPAQVEKGITNSQKRKVKVGDKVTGKDKKTGKTVEGKVVEFDEKSKKVIIIDKDKKKIQIEYNTLSNDDIKENLNSLYIKTNIKTFTQFLDSL